MKKKLTKRVVDALEIQDKEYWVADTAVAGFGVRVFPSGVKSFVYRYRFSSDRHIKVVGTYKKPYGAEGRALTADKARAVAERLQGLVRSGVNPKAAEDADKTACSVEELCDQYLSDVKAGKVLTRAGEHKSKTTISTDEGRVKRHIKPLLGKMKAKDVSKLDVEKFRDSVSSGKTKVNVKTDKKGGRSIVKGGAGTASRTLGLLGAIFSYAENNGIVESNPVRGVKRKSDQKRLRTISKDEYANIGAVLKSMANESKGKRIAAEAIWVLLLSGCRKGEILGLKKKEIDADAHALRLTETKTGAQVRPIGSAALAVLVRQDWSSKSPYVFPATRGSGHIIGAPRVWNQLRSHLGIEDVSLHTFRHGFASVAAELGYSEITIAGLLGHSTSSVTGRYIHLADPALVAAADRISTVIASRLGLAESEKVVKLRA
jgi:integrase